MVPLALSPWGDLCITPLSNRGTPSPGGEGRGEGIFLLQWPFTLCSVKTNQGRIGVHMERFQEIHPHPSPLPSREREHSRFRLGFAKVSWGRGDKTRCSLSPSSRPLGVGLLLAALAPSPRPLGYVMHDPSCSLSLGRGDKTGSLLSPSSRPLGISPRLAPLLPLISLWGEVLSWPFLLPLPVGEGRGEGISCLTHPLFHVDRYARVQ